MFSTFTLSQFSFVTVNISRFNPHLGSSVIFKIGRGSTKFENIDMENLQVLPLSSVVLLPGCVSWRMHSGKHGRASMSQGHLLFWTFGAQLSSLCSPVHDKASLSMYVLFRPLLSTPSPHCGYPWFLQITSMLEMTNRPGEDAGIGPLINKTDFMFLFKISACN